MTMNLRYLSPTDLKSMAGLTNGALPNNPTSVQDINSTQTYTLQNKDKSTTAFQIAGVDGIAVPYLNAGKTVLQFPQVYNDFAKLIPFENEWAREEIAVNGYGLNQITIYIVDADKDGDQDLLVTHSGLAGAYLVSNDPTLTLPPVYRGYMEANPTD